MKGTSYGILTAISSIGLQLPLRLSFLECHALETQRRILNENPDDIKDTEEPTPSSTKTLYPLSQEGSELGNINRRVIEIDNCALKQALSAWFETVPQRNNRHTNSFQSYPLGHCRRLYSIFIHNQPNIFEID
jgi:hypothetical protein